MTTTSPLDALEPRLLWSHFDRIRQIPRPLTDADMAAGYRWELSMRQVEFARTLAFSAPRHARRFVESLVRDNIGLGRPHEVELIFSGRRVRKGRRSKKHREFFKTKIVTRGVDVTVNVFFCFSSCSSAARQNKLSNSASSRSM